MNEGVAAVHSKCYAVEWNTFRCNCRGVVMTHTSHDLDHSVPTDDDYELPLTAAEVEQFRHERVFASAQHSAPDMYPRMTNLSAGFFMRAIVRPFELARPEYLTIAMPVEDRDEPTLKQHLAVAKWNLLWEAGQFRRRFLDDDDSHPELERIADRGDLNIIFVPRTPTRYYEYAPLFHLLSRRTAEHFGLPLLKAGQWPYIIEPFDISRFLPPDFEDRLARAWAWTVWPHLNSGSPLSAFSDDEPIKLLAHNLDFWLPPVTEVIQNTLRDFPTVSGDGELPTEIQLTDGSILQGAVPGWPRMGGDLWCGEDWAAEFVDLTVEQADQTGRLRAIMDAIKSHRVADDFSPRWSFAREDFERKLHRKRNKISVRFVELTDTIPVQSPETEVEGRVVTADFMGLLNAREREIVVLLNSGVTNLSDIADELGYANHSPISKRLAKIRQRAEQFFGPA